MRSLVTLNIKADITRPHLFPLAFQKPGKFRFSAFLIFPPSSTFNWWKNLGSADTGTFMNVQVKDSRKDLGRQRRLRAQHTHLDTYLEIPGSHAN